jgi:hypothetical protein
MTLEEIKADIVNVLDHAWSEVKGSIDVDKARAVVSVVTSTLTAHAQSAAQHLFDHVLGNAAAAQSAPAPEAVAPVAEPVVSAPEPVEAAPVEPFAVEAPVETTPPVETAPVAEPEAPAAT